MTWRRDWWIAIAGLAVMAAVGCGHRPAPGGTAGPPSPKNVWGARKLRIHSGLPVRRAAPDRPDPALGRAGSRCTCGRRGRPRTRRSAARTRLWVAPPIPAGHANGLARGIERSSMASPRSKVRVALARSPRHVLVTRSASPAGGRSLAVRPRTHPSVRTESAGPTRASWAGPKPALVQSHGSPGRVDGRVLRRRVLMGSFPFLRRATLWAGRCRYRLQHQPKSHADVPTRH
jgi:hypothetical protein